MKHKMKKFIDPNIKRKSRLFEKHLKGHRDSDKVPIFSSVEFNLCGLCNRKCVFCPRVNPKKYPNLNRHMSIPLFKKVMEELGAARFDGTMIFSAFSEPLLYRHLKEAVKEARRCCPDARLEIVTNGDLLTAAKLSELFRLGLTTLSVSMYDGPHQLDMLARLRSETGLSDTQVIPRIRWLSRRERFGINLSNRAGEVTLDDLGVGVPENPIERPCYYPFYQILVDYNGDVLLCAHDWSKQLIVGNVKNEAVLEVWNNEKMRRVRKRLIKPSRNFKPCRLCDAQGVLMGKNHFRRWVEYYEKKGRVSE